MPNYIRTGPFVNAVTPPGISAAFLNAVEAVLEQPSGGTETGKYYLLSNGYTNVANLGEYMPSISRTSVPVSVVIDTADQGATNVNAPSAGTLSANGFLISTSSTGTATNCRVAGNSTITW